MSRSWRCGWIATEGWQGSQSGLTANPLTEQTEGIEFGQRLPLNVVIVARDRRRRSCLTGIVYRKSAEIRTLLILDSIVANIVVALTGLNISFGCSFIVFSSSCPSFFCLLCSNCFGGLISVSISICVVSCIRSRRVDREGSRLRVNICKVLERIQLYGN